MENLLLTQNLGRLWASLIVNELVKGGCKNFYLSPGLRNAPFIAAIENHPNANILLGIDERAQSFRALGDAKVTGKTAVLVCTSGTAMANYFPAVIEAKKSQTPLIILSADRPSDMVYSGDNQTMKQDNLFGEFVLGSFNPGPPTIEVSPNFLTTSIANLLNKGNFPAKGPVHLNCPLREPLNQDKRLIPKEYLEQSYYALRIETKYINPTLDPSELDFNFEEVKNALLVVGPHEVKTNNRALSNLIKKWNWPFFLDACSGLKYSFNISDGATPSLDHPEVLKVLAKHPPEYIFHLGGRLISKHYYQFLKDHPNIKLITVNNQIDKEDPAHRTNIRYNCHPSAFAAKLIHLLPEKKSEQFYNWNGLVNKKIEIINAGPLTYPSISKSLLDWVPEDSILYLGNSTVIRSFDSYCSLDNKKDLKVVHHRGVSGIEGFIAAACGAGGAQDKPVTLVLGDVSFLHDLSSLMLLKSTKNPPVILIINNNGGGIFSLLPIASEEKILPYMLTPHDLSFEHMAKQFGLEYNLVDQIDTLKMNYLKALKNKRPHLIEIRVDNEQNVDIYKKLRTVKL
ncbi:MAG: 2-succinyl-5-enolpyruvyl-6-hydroxy-3-cyclohexene-1-carboxylic-acid synthase [Epsilonproteobacteria bacterium]|nr:MAG: 2-succinyl-5-enolpyruvyl-6-hydroxy-3-cyclohexene-1-carboxylic-acid synthase [Campylobacterota bacterium]